MTNIPDSDLNSDTKSDKKCSGSSTAQFVQTLEQCAVCANLRTTLRSLRKP